MSRQLTVAALGEQVPEHPGARDWLGLVTTARMVRWDTRPLHPTEPPPEVACAVAPLRRLLEQATGEREALTSHHHPGSEVSSSICGAVDEATAAYEVARDRRWVRR